MNPSPSIKSTQNHQSDNYVKKFKRKDQLVSMLFAFAKCSSLHKVAGAMLGLSVKTKHFQ